MSANVIQVVNRPHVAVWYHVLSAFDLPGDSWGCYNPAYHQKISAIRPGTTPALAKRMGEFHRHYRQGQIRESIHVLPLAFSEETQFCEAVDTLVQGTPPPPTLAPETKRALSPLTADAGAKLVALVQEMSRHERQTYWDRLYADQATALQNTAAAMQGFLNQHLSPLLDVLYPDMPQEICVFLCESLSGHARSIQPRRRNHHIAVFSQPNLQHAFFHVLLEITRRRSDRVIRHYFPANVAADPQGLLAGQMRFDAAITAGYHLLLRYDQLQIDAFMEWARRQFHHTPRKPEAAVAALHDFYLVPEDAEDAMRTLVGDTEDE